MEARLSNRRLLTRAQQPTAREEIEVFNLDLVEKGSESQVFEELADGYGFVVLS